MDLVHSDQIMEVLGPGVRDGCSIEYTSTQPNLVAMDCNRSGCTIGASRIT